MDGYLNEKRILARQCDSIFGPVQKTNLEKFLSFFGGRSLQAQSFFLDI